MTWCGWLTVVTSVVAQAQPGTLTEVIQRIDAVHYCPQRHGLKDATAAVSAPTVAAALATGTAPTEIQYVWKAPDRGRFEFTGLSRKAADARQKLLAMLQPRGRYLFPPLMKDFVARFQVSSVVQNGLFRIEGLAADPKDPLRRFVFWVSRDGRFVRRLYETTTQRELDTTIRYRSTPDGLLVAGFYATTVSVPSPPKTGAQTGKKETAASAVPLPPMKPRVIPFTDPSASVRYVTLSYQSVEGVYAPTLLSELPVRGAGTAFSLRLRDYHLNTGVQEAFFRGPGVCRSWR